MRVGDGVVEPVGGGDRPTRFRVGLQVAESDDPELHGRLGDVDGQLALHMGAGKRGERIGGLDQVVGALDRDA